MKCDCNTLEFIIQIFLVNKWKLYQYMEHNWRTRTICFLNCISEKWWSNFILCIFQSTRSIQLLGIIEQFWCHHKERKFLCKQENENWNYCKAKKCHQFWQRITNFFGSFKCGSGESKFINDRKYHKFINTAFSVSQRDQRFFKYSQQIYEHKSKPWSFW